MTPQAEIVSITAYRIYQDARFNLKPKSNEGARNWLTNARRWAWENGDRELAAQIEDYLIHLGAGFIEPAPVEFTPSFA